jgi:chromosome segregation ATPase
VIGTSLVSPADQASALAEQKRQEEAERARREAEQVRLAAAARARQEAEAREQERQRAALQAQEEQARQAREREEAQRKLAETIKALPALQTALDDQQYRSARAQWILWSLGVKLKALGGKPEKDPDEYLVAKAEVIRRVRAADARSSPCCCRSETRYSTSLTT